MNEPFSDSVDSAESGNSLFITELPSCTTSIDEKGKITKPNIPVSNQILCLQFLALCGFVFIGVDLESKKLNLAEVQMLEVLYPSNPILLTGLKAMSIADMELREGRRFLNDRTLLRCDYRLLKAETTDLADVLKDILHPLSEEAQNFITKLHRRYINMGMTCALRMLGDFHFAYAFVKKHALSTQDIYSRRIFGFSISLKYGYCLVIRPKKADKYADVIGKLPLILQEKITKGYGCYKKLGNKSCQWDCQGIRIPLDDSILAISDGIEIWLDQELSYLQRRR